MSIHVTRAPTVPLTSYDTKRSSHLKEPTAVPVTKTIGEIIIMVVRYAFVNALSLNAIFQLFSLIYCIFETPILLNIKYLIDKLFYPKKWAHFHAICIKCRGYAGMFIPSKDRYVIC